MSYEARFDRSQDRRKPMKAFMAHQTQSRVNAVIAHANRSTKDFVKFIRLGLEGSFELKIVSKQYGLSWRITRDDVKFLLNTDKWLYGILTQRYLIHPALVKAAARAVRKELL